MSFDQRFSENELSRRDIPSFIEPRPPLILNPFMRTRPEKGTNLLEQFEEDSEIEEPELVQVYLRMKPCNEINNLYEVRSDKCLLTSLDTTTAGHGRRTQHNVSRMYTFSRIFGSACSQKEIFDNVVKENLKKLPDGHSFTLLTYGASGSGKTYTLMGTVANPGLVPRALEYVFKVVDAAQRPVFKPSDTGADQLSYGAQNSELQWVKHVREISAPLRDKYRRMSVQLHSEMATSNIDLTNTAQHYIWVSFVEIYNEAIYDLLAPPDKRVKLKIREDSSGNVYVKGVSQAFVRSGSEAYDVMAAGRHNLTVAATGVHAHSSRSHCIFTITLLTEHDGTLRTSHIKLCDLAGCERQRAARNTGARMQESRAINTSLHVLERCLHMLRKKRRDTSIVPYRESKLTRLLGSGLSGSRGEAVSMVVTLNPSLSFAPETKHVLSLASVARDIQINQTMFASTLETINDSRDTTMATSAEVMKLRSDNERLHFELVQAQSRNRELLDSMEETQQQNAIKIQEYVDEAKALTTKFYEAEIKSLNDEMEELREEYETLSEKLTDYDAGTSYKHLQNKVSELMTEIAVLEENLIEEKLARARAEKEVQHLRTCIEERDEKAFSDNTDEKEIVLTDSENDDPFNESLEPIFRKELNKTQNSRLEKENHPNTQINDNDKTLNNSNDLNDSNCTLKDVSVSKEVLKGDEESMDDFSQAQDNKHSFIKTTNNDFKDSLNDSLNNTEKDRSETEDVFFEATEIQDKGKDKDIFKDNFVKSDKPQARGTYFVETGLLNQRNDKEIISKDNFGKNDKPQVSGNYSVDAELQNQRKDKEIIPKDKSVESEKLKVRGTYFVDAPSLNTHKDINEHKTTDPKTSGNFVNKIIKSLKTSMSSDSSLRQFEQLEMAANDYDNNKTTENQDFSIKMKKRNYFYDDNETIHEIEETDKIHKKDENTNLEKDNVGDKTNTVNLTNAAKKQEQKLYFDTPKIDTNEILISRSGNTEKRTYFDNIDPLEPNKQNVKDMFIANKKLDDLKYDERSPSIVKEDVGTEYKPSTMKKLLGESYTENKLSSIQKTLKKADSLDLFESPKILNLLPKEDIEKTNKVIEKNKTPTKTKDINIDEIGKSIEKLKLKETKELEPLIKTCQTTENDNNIVKETQSIEEINNKKPINNESLNNTQKDNTIEEFDNICKDLSDVRATQFDLLISQEINASDVKDNESRIDTQTQTDYRQNLEIKIEPKDYPEDDQQNAQNGEKTKTAEKSSDDSKDDKLNTDSLNNDNKQKQDDAKLYNLRRKNDKTQESEVTAESHSKCESKTSKRSLRLRRRKNYDDEDLESHKLRDIVNLKKEFSDVTMGQPAVAKEVKDIPSPEKLPGEENLPPLMGIQSCPSKSVQRSRRKLFTPRAEPLEESLGQADSNERLYVPRPSYHRTRARRKL